MRSNNGFVLTSCHKIDGTSKGTIFRLRLRSLYWYHSPFILAHNEMRKSRKAN